MVEVSYGGNGVSSGRRVKDARRVHESLTNTIN